jgi:sugar phosphate isomerase/epimerase
MHSRRDFARLALAGTPLALAARPKSTINGVLIGAQSYSFRDRPLDEAIQGYMAAGLSECELWQGHLEPPYARNKEDREKIRQWRLSVPAPEVSAVRDKFKKAGVTLYAYNYSFRDDMTDEELERGFFFARALGVKCLTASSTLTTAKRLAPFAEKHKVLVGMHNHSNLKDPNEFATPESFAQALAMSKHFRVNLDIGHFFAAGFDPVRYIGEHHDKIVCLHIKDRKANQGENVPFGEGGTPIKEVLQLLKTKRYRIPANIEYEYKGQEAVAEVKRCYEYCRKALA